MFRFAVLFPGAGLIIQEVPATGDPEILRALQAALGGPIEIIHTARPGLDAFADEDGLSKALPYNETASRMLRTLSGLSYQLVGPVAFVSRDEDEPASLTDEHLAEVATAYNRFVPATRRVSPSGVVPDPDAAEQDQELASPAEFYSLPATKLEEGMSTADGQDFVDVTVDAEGIVFGEVYTPRSDDPEQDEANREETDTRVYLRGERVDLAVFSDTVVDGRNQARGDG